MLLSSLLAGFATDAVHPAVVLVAKTTVLLVAALGVTFVLQRASAGTRHLVWLVTLGALLVLPALAAWAPWRVAILPAAPAAPAAAAAPVASPAPTPRAVEGAAASAPEPWILREAATPAHDAGAASAAHTFRRLSPRATVLAVWAGVSLLILAWLAHGALAVHRIVRNARPLRGNGWRVPLLEVADRLGLEDAPRLLVSDETKMPFACGLRTPTIVLPSDCESWSLDRRHAVLLHELAHVKRRDLVSHTLGRLACAVYWFHPLAWAAAKQLRAESERACDDLALTCGARASDYAEHLLDIVASVRGDRTPAVALAMARRREFEGRMLAILDPGLRRTSPSRRQALAVAGSVGLMALLVGAATPVARLDAAAPAALPDVAAVPDASPSQPSPVAGHHAVAPVAHDTTRVVERTSEQATQRKVERQEQQVASLPQLQPQVDVRTAVGAAMQKGMDAGMSAGLRVAADASVGSTGGANAGTSVNANALLARMQQARDDERPRLLANVLATDSSATLRRIAAWGLHGYADEPVAATALANALRRDASANVREMAAWALAHGGSRRSEATEALASAVRQDASANVRATAAWALGTMGDRESIPALTAALADTNVVVRKAAAWAIGNAGPRSAPKELVALLGDANPRVRMTAAWALFNIEDPTTADALDAALRAEKDRDLQLAYVRALLNMGDRAIEPIKRLLDSSDPEVKAAAVRALAGARGGGPWPMPWPMPRPQP